MKSRLKPRVLDLFEEDKINFLIVRHPLDRILSAFRDRILNPKTDQVKIVSWLYCLYWRIVSSTYWTNWFCLWKARKHTKKMKKYPAQKGEKLPTFSQFLHYITGKDSSSVSVATDWVQTTTRTPTGLPTTPCAVPALWITTGSSN